MPVLIFTYAGFAVFIIVFIIEYPFDKKVPDIIDTLQVAGNIKVLTNIFKYVPLIVNNYKMKTTKGFNVWGAIADFVGGVTCTLQVFFDIWYAHNEWVNPFTASEFNVINVVCGLLAMIFNIIFFVQYF